MVLIGPAPKCQMGQPAMSPTSTHSGQQSHLTFDILGGRPTRPLAECRGGRQKWPRFCILPRQFPPTMVPAARCSLQVRPRVLERLSCCAQAKQSVPRRQSREKKGLISEYHATTFHRPLWQDDGRFSGLTFFDGRRSPSPGLSIDRFPLRKSGPRSEAHVGPPRRF